MKEKIKLPDFIREYLRSKLRLCLVIAIPSALIAGLLIFHMSTTALMVLFTALFSALFFIFAGLAAPIWLNLRCDPYFNMYRILKQHGDPQALLDQLDTLSRWHKESPLRDPIVNEHIVLIPFFTYVYIAPISAINWAYISLHIIRTSRYSTKTEYRLNFRFNTGDKCSKKIYSKGDGVSLLKFIKNKNPKVAVGYNRTCPNSQADIRGHWGGHVPHA